MFCFQSPFARPRAREAGMQSAGTPTQLEVDPTTRQSSNNADEEVIRYIDHEQESSSASTGAESNSSSSSTSSSNTSHDNLPSPSSCLSNNCVMINPPTSQSADKRTTTRWKQKLSLTDSEWMSDFNITSCLSPTIVRTSPPPPPLDPGEISPSATTNSTNDIDYNEFSDFDDEDDEDETCGVEDSLPSSPAAISSCVALSCSASTVPYYDFLSVGGGVMRQETSTSSPQLSTTGGAGGGANNVVQRTSSSSPIAKKEPFMSQEKLKSSDLGGLQVMTTACLPAARSCPNLERQTGAEMCLSASGSSTGISAPGPRFKPMEEGDIQLCYLNHTRTLVSKILSSKFLRRWETHHLYLNDACMSSKTVSYYYV